MSLRILITGSEGNLGKGMRERLRHVDHEVVLTDITGLRAPDEEFVPCDLLSGVGLDRAMEGCDLVLHTAAWHGIHLQERTAADFWELNVDGTRRVLAAAAAAKVDRCVFVSSMGWYDRYGTYGFTKVIGEELCEHYRRRHGLRYVAVRPDDFTPWGEFVRYGERLLYWGVDREDVLNCVGLAIERLASPSSAGVEPEAIVVPAVRANAFSEKQIEGWEEDPVAACERVFPGSADLVRRYELDVSRRPFMVDAEDAADTVGYRPSRHFGTFLEELAALDRAGGPTAVAAQRCTY